ncbi:MAG: thioredoxin family protein [Phycisphaerales bacterium]|nr:thioredoxin family protein [Phycisphaerales bacterium]
MPVVQSSSLLALGATIPPFELADTVTGRLVSPTQFDLQPLLIAFISNHCPYVTHIQSALAQLGRFCSENAVAVVGISANDPLSYPADAPSKMGPHARSAGWTFPYCFDATQRVAQAFHAACTPEFFLFDKRHQLFYHGQLDSSRPGSGVAATGADLRGAITLLLAGQPGPEVQIPAMGCSIKWHD